MDNWITLSTLSGDSGTTTVTITAATQQELIERTTSFTVKTNYTNLQQTVEVEQLMYLGLRFNITNGGNIYWIGSSSKTIQYRKNGGEWISITSTTGSGVDIPVQSGDILFFKGDNDEYRYSSFSASTGTNFKVSGNIMSLIDSTNYENLTTLSSAYTFNGLFENCSGLTDASELLLPATTLAERCYYSMFNGCTSLVNAPALPATTLSNFCYVTMFSGCTSLTTAPALPATTLTTGCYGSIFRNCTNLTGAPELPATTLANSCYGGMFYGCTSLTTAPALPATTLKQSCYNNMFNGCTSLTTAPELPATTLTIACYINMFSGCTSLVNAPALPATTLADNCYQGMFSNCTSLTKAPVLPATTLVPHCYNSMFQGCSNLNYIKCFATDISAYDCTYNWVNGVAPTGTFYKPEEMEDWLIDNVNGIPIGWTVQDIRLYLTFNIIGAGNIYLHNTATHSGYDSIEYKINTGNWIYNDSTNVITIPVVPGDVIEFRGNIDEDTYMFAGSTAQFSVEGNIMSVIDSTNFNNLTILESAYTFQYAFKNCTGLTDASKLLLPATVLTPYCYNGMFSGCTSLITAPNSIGTSATTLADNCCYEMFEGCSSLVNAPALPATTLAYYCYQYMFAGCSSLTQAPELPATTLFGYCYYCMFQGCSSLTTAPELPATTLTQDCYAFMFNGCTSLTTAPALPATTLSGNCYANMFNGCSSLVNVPMIIGNVLTVMKDNCCQNMFYRCTRLTTAPALPSTTLASGCYSGMFNGCTNLTGAPELPATTLANSCYSAMFGGCGSLTTAPELPATTLVNDCYSSMFYRCTSLTTAPVLPATTLTNFCYHYMFYGCTSLNYIKCLATNISATFCTLNWVGDVSNSGTFVKATSMTDWPTRGIDGIPDGWTVQDA